MCGPVFFGPNSIGLFTAILVHVIDGPSQLPPSFVGFLTGFPAGSFLPAAGQARDRNMAITKTDKKTKKSEPTASLISTILVTTTFAGCSCWKKPETLSESREMCSS